MKKIIAGLMAATVFTITGPASAYEATVETEVEADVPKKAKKGEKVKVKFELGTTTNGEVCTGRVEMTVLKLKPNGDVKKTMFIKEKEAEDLKQGSGDKFALKLFQTGKYLVIVKYRRGKQDPCAFSRTAETIKITPA